MLAATTVTGLVAALSRSTSALPLVVDYAATATMPAGAVGLRPTPGQTRSSLRHCRLCVLDCDSGGRGAGDGPARLPPEPQLPHPPPAAPAAPAAPATATAPATVLYHLRHPPPPPVRRLPPHLLCARGQAATVRAGPRAPPPPPQLLSPPPPRQPPRRSLQLPEPLAATTPHRIYRRHLARSGGRPPPLPSPRHPPLPPPLPATGGRSGPPTTRRYCLPLLRRPRLVPLPRGSCGMAPLPLPPLSASCGHGGRPVPPHGSVRWGGVFEEKRVP